LQFGQFGQFGQLNDVFSGAAIRVITSTRQFTFENWAKPGSARAKSICLLSHCIFKNDIVRFSGRALTWKRFDAISGRFLFYSRKFAAFQPIHSSLSLAVAANFTDSISVGSFASAFELLIASIRASAASSRWAQASGIRLPPPRLAAARTALQSETPARGRGFPRRIHWGQQMIIVRDFSHPVSRFFHSSHSPARC
jgi:hypothetical protein